MKACIFDLDGTIGDTLDSLVYSVEKTLEEMKLPLITRDQCRRFVGNGARVLVEMSLDAAGDKGATRIEEGMQVYRRIFDVNCTYHVTAYEGIPEMLDTLKNQGMKLAVLSNKPHAQTVKVVKAMCGEDTMDWIQGQMDPIPRKPDPTGVYYVAEKLGVAVEDCLYVGDSEVDIETGRRAGAKTVGVSWGFRSRKDLEDAGAACVVDTPDELLEFACK